MNRLGTTPTTVNWIGTRWTAGLRCTPGSDRTPYRALNLTVVPRTEAGIEYPRMEASVSVSSTSAAESEAGIRPAVSVIAGLDWAFGGSDTSAPTWGITPNTGPA